MGKFRKLDRGYSHRLSMLRSYFSPTSLPHTMALCRLTVDLWIFLLGRTMVSQLVKHERIETTVAKVLSFAAFLRARACGVGGPAEGGSDGAAREGDLGGQQAPHCEGQSQRGRELSAEGKLAMRGSSTRRASSLWKRYQRGGQARCGRELSGTQHAATRAAAFVRGDDVVHKLFTDLAYRYS
ncbi:hypothetical protein ZEAMMB73_Zm00001d017942 [Zea mays]|uniref:Uncharacterized protein n=1 Tax=Zea mays TaxID=4577 RepID=A0A1D6HJB6_MAIZE|nr:hypothetical protein ZEAMMB73_Zm00001d017942 [Zea mays]